MTTLAHRGFSKIHASSLDRMIQGWTAYLAAHHQRALFPVDYNVNDARCCCALCGGPVPICPSWSVFTMVSLELLHNFGIPQGRSPGSPASLSPAQVGTAWLVGTLGFLWG